MGPNGGIRHAGPYVVALVFAVAGAGCGGAGDGASPEAAKDAARSPADGRTAVELPAPARRAVLTEMRAMLEAIHEVLVAAAEGDRAAMARGARSGGTVIAVDTDPEVARGLPDEFIQLGSSTHHAFDSLAAAVDSGISRDSVLTRLGSLTARCVACHSSYRMVARE